MKRIGLVAIVLSAFVFGTALSARAQAGEDARMPVPPTPPAPGNLPDLNGVWVLPYTPDLTRAYGGPLPFTPLEEGVTRTLEHFQRLQAEGRLDTADLDG